MAQFAERLLCTNNHSPTPESADKDMPGTLHQREGLSIPIRVATVLFCGCEERFQRPAANCGVGYARRLGASATEYAGVCSTTNLATRRTRYAEGSLLHDKYI